MLSARPATSALVDVCAKSIVGPGIAIVPSDLAFFYNLPYIPIVGVRWDCESTSFAIGNFLSSRST